MASFWGYFRVSQMLVFSLECFKTRTRGVDLAGSQGHRFEQLFRHSGSSDSLVWWGCCVPWAGQRFPREFIIVFDETCCFYTSFVVSGFVRGRMLLLFVLVFGSFCHHRRVSFLLLCYSSQHLARAFFFHSRKHVCFRTLLNPLG